MESFLMCFGCRPCEIRALHFSATLFICICKVCTDNYAAHVLIGHEKAADMGETCTLAMLDKPGAAITICYLSPSVTINILG